MSAPAVNMLLGVGQLYVKRTTDSDGKYKRIGSIKKQAKFTYKPTFVEQRPSDTLNFTRRDKVEESAKMMVEVVDWRTDQLRAAFGLSISTTTLSKTMSIRLAQELTTPASTTTTRSISRTAKSTTSVAFSSLDRATDYARGTDFTMVSTKKYKAISAAFKGSKAVRAYYTHKFTGSGVQLLSVGNNPALQQVSVMFVFTDTNKKSLAIIFPIATIDADFSAAFQEKEYTTYETTFSALGDPTAAKGKQLFYIVRET